MLFYEYNHDSKQANKEGNRGYAASVEEHLGLLFLSSDGGNKKSDAYQKQKHCFSILH